MGYEVLKSYNNNVVLAKQDNKTVVLVSKGIGFGKKPGDIIENTDSIEKVFHEINPQEQPLSIQTAENSYEALESIVDQIVATAQEELGELNDNLQRALNDHIQFAVQRIEMGITIENPFVEEIIALYSEEFKIAGVAALLIKECTGVDIGEEERGFIALHIRSSRNNEHIGETLRKTRLYTNCIELIAKHSGKKIDLKQKANKVFISNLELIMESHEKLVVLPPLLLKGIQKDLTSTYKIAEQIKVMMETEKRMIYSEAIKGYLVVEIEKLLSFN